MMRLSTLLLVIVAAVASDIPPGTSATANDIAQEHCLAQKSVTRVAAEEQLQQARTLMSADEGAKQPGAAEEGAKHQDAIKVVVATPHEGHQGGLLQHQDKIKLGKKNGPAFMNMTKMDQSTLPKDSRHINHKTVSADWFEEYPLAAAEKPTEEKEVKGEKGAALGVRLATATTAVVAAFSTMCLLHF
mmetsp:Transcript_132001/g.263415  ORF Transcript_132001/g.263415 Transcript_132001/m.263415 type:complete len:188 (+) Transcript_132001:121-684(+)